MAQALRKVEIAPIKALQMRLDGFPVTDVKGIVERFTLPLSDDLAPMYGEQWIVARVRKIKELDEGQPGTDGRPVMRTEAHAVVECFLITEEQVDSLDLAE